MEICSSKQENNHMSDMQLEIFRHTKREESMTHEEEKNNQLKLTENWLRRQN